MAFPASLPRNHAASSASARSTNHGTTKGLPENRITITGIAEACARSKTASASRR